MSAHSMNTLKIFLGLVAGLSTVEANSSTNSFVATLSAARAWHNGGEDQTFYLAPELEKAYAAANSASQSLVNAELFLGFQHQLTPYLQNQLGMALFGTTNARLKGEIWDDADSQFNNYTYKYTVQHTHVALESKLLLETSLLVIPWISGSLGVGFNRAANFSNTPTIFQAVTNPNFVSNTTTAFSYTVGAGIQAPLDSHWQVGVGYEFADWGKSNLDRAPSQTQNSGLALSHLYTNGITCNITYLAS